MKSMKLLSLILFAALALFVVPGMAKAQPPTLTTDVESLPKEALPLKIVYNYERGNVDGTLDANGVELGDLRTDLGELKGVTVGETFVPADGKTKEVEVAVEVPGDDKLWIRIRLSVTVWEDRAGNVYVRVRLSVSVGW